MQVKMLPIDWIKAAPFQPRKGFDAEKLKELADSISEHDLIQPITVRKVGEGYQIIAGERRFRAMKQLGHKEVPVIVRDATDNEAMEMSLIENWQREDLTSVEREDMVTSIWKTGNYKSHAELARRLGCSPKYINDFLRIKEIRNTENEYHGIHSRIIGETLSLPSEDRKQVLKKVIDGELRVGMGRENLGDYIKTIKNVSDPIKAAMLKPQSRITPEIAKKLAEFPEPEQQKAMIKEIEKSKNGSDQGIAATMDINLKIAKGQLPKTTTFGNSAERYVEELSRISENVLTYISTAKRIQELDEKHKKQAIMYIRTIHNRTEKVLTELGELKYVKGNAAETECIDVVPVMTNDA